MKIDQLRLIGCGIGAGFEFAPDRRSGNRLKNGQRMASLAVWGDMVNAYLVVGELEVILFNLNGIQFS